MTRGVSPTELTRDTLQSINQMRMEIDLNNAFGLGRKRKGDSTMLWTIAGILLVLWLLGFSMNVGGGLIHALLVIAIIVFVFNLIAGRRSSA